MAQVTANTDNLAFIPTRIKRDVLIVMAAETTQRIGMVFVVGIGAPIQIHVWEIGIGINFL